MILAPLFVLTVLVLFCGRPDADNRIQLYTQAECALLPNSRWNLNEQCLKTTTGSYSWDCRPGAGTGGANMDAYEKRFNEHISTNRRLLHETTQCKE